ncbi:MAG: flagellar biosynthesis regulator FlaF [Pseudomonadota bacterium]
MNASQQAQTAYGAGAAPTRSPRSTEYDAFARVTQRLHAANQSGKPAFHALAAALHDNRRLWALLASSVADADNALPADLKSTLFYLAEFTQVQTSRILAGEADASALIEINMRVMQGLRGEGPPS